MRFTSLYQTFVLYILIMHWSSVTVKKSMLSIFWDLNNWHTNMAWHYLNPRCKLDLKKLISWDYTLKITYHPTATHCRKNILVPWWVVKQKTDSVIFGYHQLCNISYPKSLKTDKSCLKTPKEKIFTMVGRSDKSNKKS